MFEKVCLSAVVNPEITEEFLLLTTALFQNVDFYVNFINAIFTILIHNVSTASSIGDGVNDHYDHILHQKIPYKQFFKILI